MKTVVFDLDGTLVDSVPDLASAINHVLMARGLAGFAAHEVQAMVGDGARALVERAFNARAMPADDAALAAFLDIYTSHAAIDTRAYPGVRETLEALRTAGFTLAVCTNKPIIPAREVLRALGLAEFFSVVGGGDSYPVRKPNPGHLLALLAELGAQPRAAIMVGDHHNDIHAARDAGVRSIWAAWGYGSDGAGADAVARRFGDILTLVQSAQS